MDGERGEGRWLPEAWPVRGEEGGVDVLGWMRGDGLGGVGKVLSLGEMRLVGMGAYQRRVW